MLKVTFGLVVYTILIGFILIKIIKACKEPSISDVKSIDIRCSGLEMSLYNLQERIQSLEQVRVPQDPPDYPY